jgi:multisite-specific tRNA:(cytosine-C5)-methyltransferase
MNNALFELYYKSQAIVPEHEWDAFLDALREPLPTTFRVAGSRQLRFFRSSFQPQMLKRHRVARALNDVVRDTYIPNLTDLVFEGEAIPPPRQIPWHVSFDRER